MVAHPTYSSCFTTVWQQAFCSSIPFLHNTDKVSITFYFITAGWPAFSSYISSMCYYTMAAVYWRYKIFPLFCSHKSNIIRKIPLSSVFSVHSLSLTGVLKSASRPCRTLFPGFFPLLRFKNRKTPIRESFLFWYARRDWLRRHGAHSLMLTGVLKSAFCLWSNPFPRVLSLMALKTKNSHSGVFFVLVRAQGFEPWTH